MSGHDLAATLTNHSIVLCGGSGGVGKTTTAAALGIAAAALGVRTLVLTIDPARRLAEAMGIRLQTSVPEPVPEVPDLFAMMLDAGNTIDRLVERFARDDRSAQAFLDNAYYRQIAATVAGAREFMAMAQVYELAGRGEFDLIIVDTPPTRHALDFLDAPRRLIELLDGSGLGVILRASNLANRMTFGMLARSQNQFARLVESLTGHRIMLDMNEFFDAFADIIDGFKARAARLQALLRGESSTFLLVLAPDSELSCAAHAYLARLREERMTIAAVIFNQVHGIGAHRGAAEVRVAARGAGLEAGITDRMLACHARWRDRSIADARVVETWRSGGHPDAILVPRYARNVSSLDDLRQFAGDLMA